MQRIMTHGLGFRPETGVWDNASHTRINYFFLFLFSFNFLIYCPNLMHVYVVPISGIRNLSILNEIVNIYFMGMI